LAVGKLGALLDGRLQVGISLLESRVLDDPLGLIGTRQFCKCLLIPDELRLQGADERIQPAGVLGTLLLDLLSVSLDLTLGFCRFAGLAAVVLFKHALTVDIRQFGLLQLDGLAIKLKLDLRIFRRVAGLILALLWRFSRFFLHIGAFLRTSLERGLQFLLVPLSELGQLAQHAVFGAAAIGEFRGVLG
jgi:hypothetical protein